jgi:hypothetical protein
MVTATNGGAMYETPRVGGHAVERTWTMIAADRDDEALPAEIGRRRLEREAAFAMQDDAAAWLHEQELNGFEDLIGPTPYATRFFGESDSPSNAWIARASRELERGGRCVLPRESAATITFERDGKTHVAVVGEPVAPTAGAMIVEHAGEQYAIAIRLGVRLGDAPFVARPVLEQVALPPLEGKRPQPFTDDDGVELVTDDGRLTVAGAERLLGEDRSHGGRCV